MVVFNEGSPNVADTGFRASVFFELGAEMNSFSADDDQLQVLNLYIDRSCFCVGAGAQPITSGCMQGERQEDGSWFVQGNLLDPITGEIKFDAFFEK